MNHFLICLAGAAVLAGCQAILRDESLEEALYIMTLLYPVKYEVIDRERLTDNSYSKRKINLKMN